MFRIATLTLAMPMILAAGAHAQDMQEMDDMDRIADGIWSVGVFTTPHMADEAGPLMPGHAYEVTFEAPGGAHLSLATMFVQSNDWFYATAPSGLALFDDEGRPRSGDVTAELHLWDAGTEADQPPGEGADQAPRQAGSDTGPRDPDRSVRRVGGMMTDGLPMADKVIRVTVTHDGMGGRHHFTLRVENVASDVMLETMDGGVPLLLSPGLWVVHGAGARPLFTPGEPDRGDGLESLAEDGDPSELAASLMEMTGSMNR